MPHLKKIGETMLHGKVVLPNGRFDNVLGVAGDIRVAWYGDAHLTGRSHLRRQASQRESGAAVARSTVESASSGLTCATWQWGDGFDVVC